MKRVAVIGDSHYDESSRFEECIRLHDEFASWVECNGVNLVVHTGDLFERRSTPRERQAVANLLQRVASHCPVAIVRGNHDAEEDIAFLSRLAADYPIVAVERPEVVTLAGVSLALLPWPRKAALLAALGDVSQEEAGQVAQEALRGVLRGLNGALRAHPAGPRMLVSHAMVRGSVTSHGQPLVGHDLELGLEDLALLEVDAYALGHIHMGQGWEVEGRPVFYPGSPRRTAFGELEKKGFAVVDFSDCSFVEKRFVELSATPMILLEGKWLDGALLGLEHPPLGHAEVRLRYQVPIDQREAARVEASAWKQRILDAGAVSVKVEEVVDAQQRARAPEVASARTLREQLEAYWARYGFEPGDRRASLLSKLEGLESSHAH